MPQSVRQQKVRVKQSVIAGNPPPHSLSSVFTRPVDKLENMPKRTYRETLLGSTHKSLETNERINYHTRETPINPHYGMKVEGRLPYGSC